MSTTVQLLIHSKDSADVGHLVVSDAGKIGKPLIVKGQSHVIYELKDTAANVAPNQVLTKRNGKNLEIKLDADGHKGEDSEAADIIIEDYYEASDAQLIGVAEDGQFYPYVPQEGQTSLLASELSNGSFSYQSLGLTDIAPIPVWWYVAGGALALGAAGLAFAGGDDSSTPASIASVPVADSATTNEDTPVAISVLTNDTDVDGNPATLVSATNGAHGTTSVNTATGVVTYTPNANWSGTDTFTYTNSEGHTETVTVTVTPATDLSAADDTATTNEDTPLNATVASNDSTTSGGTLTYTKTTDPTHGTVTVFSDGTYTYIPDSNYSGSDSFTYTVTDASSGDSSTQTVSITVNPVVDLIAADDTGATNLNTPFSSSVASNDSTTSGGTLSFAKTTDPSHGTITFYSNGTYTYTPTANYSGSDSFTYTVTDASSGESLTKTVNITVNPTVYLNATDDTAATDEDTPLNATVASNDSTTSGGTLTYTKTTDPAHGTVTVNNDGTYTYTPTANYNGSDSFTYTVTDGTSGESLTKTVSITVSPVADLSAADDTGTTSENTPLNATVASNDSTTSGGTLSFAKTTDPAHGTVTVNNDGTYTYTPTANYSGNDSFTYTVTDVTSGESLTKTAYITVNPGTPTPLNTAPSGADHTFAHNEDTNYTFITSDFGFSDSVDSDALSGVNITTLPASGTLFLDSNGNGSIDGGEAISAGTTVSVAEINAGSLKFYDGADESGTTSYTFQVVDNGGVTTNTDQSANTMTINTVAVADTPNLTFDATRYTTKILYSNVNSTTDGFHVTAYNEDGTMSTVSKNTGNPDGFGVAGASSGGDAEIGRTVVGSESLVVDFDNPITWMGVSFAWQNHNEAHQVDLYSGGVLVGSYTYTGGSDAIDPMAIFRATGGVAFDQAVFTAPASPAGSDYLIHSITFEQVTTTSTDPMVVSDDSMVRLHVTSSLNDTDGSETLSVVLSGIPIGFTVSDGTNTFTATSGNTSVDITNWTMASIDMTIPANVTGMAQITVTSTATEGSNGSTSSEAKTINMNVYHDPISANNDASVITNSATDVSFTIPEWTLLYNDAFADNITATSGATDVGSLSLSGSGDVILTDTGAAGGSFTYTASTVVYNIDTDSSDTRTDTASVTIAQDIAGSVDGTASNNILLDVLTTDDILNGLAGDDILISTAASGNDTLNGGDGNDTLSGGGGNDIFLFDSALDSTLNVDTILDFNSADDTLQLDSTIFTALSIGALGATNFVAGTSAVDGDDYILFDAATGNIWYDADGNGAGTAVLFATLNAPTGTIDNTNFAVI